MSNEQEMREAFEIWRKGCGWKDNIYWAINSEGKYIWLVTQTAWEVWQAATLAAEARIRELEAALKTIKALPAEYASFHDSASRQGYGIRYLEVHEIIDAALTEHKENQG